MKIKVVKKGTKSKPSNFCPWLVDDPAATPK
jgi:hypothetical protein